VDVQVAADGISAQHCSVEVVKGGVKVTDLGSTNGTLINGRDVRGPHHILTADY
jgi:pSer/pThr/pTyr-binding forkhead associated (FHA) protein